MGRMPRRKHIIDDVDDEIDEVEEIIEDADDDILSPLSSSDRKVKANSLPGADGRSSRTRDGADIVALLDDTPEPASQGRGPSHVSSMRTQLSSIQDMTVDFQWQCRQDRSRSSTRNGGTSRTSSTPSDTTSIGSSTSSRNDSDTGGAGVTGQKATITGKKRRSSASSSSTSPRSAPTSTLTHEHSTPDERARGFGGAWCPDPSANDGNSHLAKLKVRFVSCHCCQGRAIANDLALVIVVCRQVPCTALTRCVWHGQKRACQCHVLPLP